MKDAEFEELHPVWVVPTKHACDVCQNGGPATMAKVEAGLPIHLCKNCLADFDTYLHRRGVN